MVKTAYLHHKRQLWFGRITYVDLHPRTVGIQPTVCKVLHLIKMQILESIFIRLNSGIHLPQAHMSTGFPYGSFFSTSGDR